MVTLRGRRNISTGRRVQVNGRFAAKRARRLKKLTGSARTADCKFGDRGEGALDMTVQDQISEYMSAQSAAKREDVQALHQLILGVSPGCELRFLDGRNEDGKIVSNPSIGYGSQTIKYADGKTKEFYEIGLSVNTSGISIYLIGVDDRKFLSETYGSKLGRASITGYCVKFKRLADINLDVLKDMIAGHTGRRRDA
jgi:hypothetical protein